jgi:YVTN family beta-propeller protein
VVKKYLSLLLIGFAFASSALAQTLFCPARYSDEVAVIDTSTNQVVTQIPVGVGAFPIRITITLDLLKAFVSDNFTSSISVIDTVALTNSATIPVERRPGTSAITPNGTQLWVVHQIAVQGDPNHSPVEVIDTATNQVITTVLIPGQGAKDILFTLDGSFAYIANNTLGQVDVIDTTTYQVTTIPTEPGSRRLAISPAGDRIYVTNNHGTPGSVSAIDTATQQVIATIPVGAAPFDVGVTPNNNEVYVTNQGDMTVSVIDTTTLTVIATIPTGILSQQLVITPDGTKVFVANGFSDTVSVIDTATHTVIATIPVAHHPWTIRLSPDDMKLYVCGGHDTKISVIDVASLTVSATIDNVGSGPWDLGFGPPLTPTATPTATATASATPAPRPTPTPRPRPRPTPAPRP